MIYLAGCVKELTPDGSETNTVNSNSIPGIAPYAKSTSQPIDRECRAFNQAQILARDVAKKAGVLTAFTADLLSQYPNGNGLTERLMEHYVQNVSAPGVVPADCETPFTLSSSDMSFLMEEAIQLSKTSANFGLHPSANRAKVAKIDDHGRMVFQSNGLSLTDWIKSVEVPEGGEYKLQRSPHHFMLQTQVSGFTLGGMDVHFYSGGFLRKNKNGSWKFLARVTFNDDWGPEPKDSGRAPGIQILTATFRALVVGNPFLIKSFTDSCAYMSSDDRYFRLVGDCSRTCLNSESGC